MGTQNSAKAGAYLRVGDGTAVANLLPSAKGARISGSELPTSKWAHLAMTVSRKKGLKLYIDGRLIASDPKGISHRCCDNFKIGARPDGDTNGFAGMIDDVRIFGAVLSGSEIESLAEGAIELPLPRVDSPPFVREIEGHNPEILSYPNSQPEGNDSAAPVIRRLYPNDGSSNIPAGSNLPMTFDEPIKLATGRIFIRNITDWDETEIAVGSPRATVEGNVLTISPPTDLPDGDRSLMRMVHWQGAPWLRIFNPSGEGLNYIHDELIDKDRSQGMIGVMRGPIMATIGVARTSPGISHDLGAVLRNRHYHVSLGIGVRDDQGESVVAFLGYSIRLKSGSKVLAELTAATPPGPPNSVNAVGFSWDSTFLPEGVALGDPISIEITPNRTSDSEIGYLDVDNIRVSVVKKENQ